MTMQNGPELKIVIAGPMGAGKTTAIGVISQIPVLSTEAANSDRLQSAKASTTVALDYGEVTLDSGEKLKIFGTPGQLRFDFMWRHLAQGALGLIILLDAQRPDPCADLAEFLKGFTELVASGRVVIGLGRYTKNSPLREMLMKVLERQGLRSPVMTVDVRKRDDVLLLLDILFHIIEAEEPFA